MSKTLGKVLAVAAVVVAVAAAIPTGGGSFLLAASIAAPVSAGLAVASLLNNDLLAAKARNSLQARQASVVSLQLGEVPREMIVGKAMTGGSLVDAFNYGGSNGTDWEVLVVALADHECDSLVGFYVNDQYVAFAGDGAVTGYNGQLEVYWRPGTMTQTPPAVLTTNGPGWTATDAGVGVSYAVACYKADKADAKNPIWTAGRPSFAWVVKGKKCYQARLDSSVGGSGAHRWSDPTTWSWTDNLIDCRYNWVRGVYAGNQVTQPGMLLVGRGLTDVEAPPANVFAPANVCDEAVTLDAGGSEQRYRVNGVIRADEAFIDVEEHFAAACGGVIHQPEGAVEIEPGQAKSSVFFFSDDDLIVGSTVEFSDDLPETDEGWVNTVVPRYIEPAQKYAEHAAPIRRVTADLVADGGPREQSLSLALVTSSTQAGRVGEIARRLGRLLRRGKVTLGPGFAEIEEGDWGTWTSQRYLGGASVVFRVEAYALDEKWQNTLVLREISSICYSRDSDAASNTVALQQVAPSIGAPGAGAFSLTAGALAAAGDSVPALIITGATDNSFAELVRFEYLPSAGVTDTSTASGWREDGTAGPDVKRREIQVAPNTGYYVGVSYIVGRVPGPRRILGPVTTGSVATAQATTALTKLGVLAASGYLHAGEDKREIVREVADISAEYPDIFAKADAAGVDRSTYGVALSAIGTYLGTLTPLWSDATQDTAIVPSTFTGVFSDYYYARQLLLNAIAAKAATTANWSGIPGGTGKSEDFATFGDNLIYNSALTNDTAGWTLGSGVARTAASPGDPLFFFFSYTLPGAGASGGVTSRMTDLPAAEKFYWSYLDNLPNTTATYGYIYFFDNTNTFVGLGSFPFATGTGAWATRRGVTAVPIGATRYYVQLSAYSFSAAGVLTKFGGLRVGKTQLNADVTTDQPIVSRLDPATGQALNARILRAYMVSGASAAIYSTNPLSISRTSGVSTITINPHSITDDVGTISFSGGSIGGLTAASGTVYAVYEDNDYTGGARTYVATVNPADLAGSPNRRLVGFIIVPADGGSGAGGGNGSVGGRGNVEP